jgi:hypothetical protein
MFASANIVTNAEAARTVLLRPTLRRDVKSGCKERQMQAKRQGASMVPAVEKLGAGSGLRSGGDQDDGRHDGVG